MQILATPDVAERVELYFEHAERAKEQVRRCATVHGNLVVLDLRNEEVIHPTNRFMIYALFPQCNVSMHVLWGLKQQNTVFATGKSILDRSSRTNIGELMLEYGGGGHDAAGTCQVSNTRAPKVLGELIERINADEGRGGTLPSRRRSRPASARPRAGSRSTGGPRCRAAPRPARDRPAASVVDPEAVLQELLEPGAGGRGSRRPARPARARPAPGSPR